MDLNADIESAGVQSRSAHEFLQVLVEEICAYREIDGILIGTEPGDSKEPKSSGVSLGIEVTVIESPCRSRKQKTFGSLRPVCATLVRCCDCGRLPGAGFATKFSFPRPWKPIMGFTAPPEAKPYYWWKTKTLFAASLRKCLRAAATGCWPPRMQKPPRISSG